MTSCLVSSRPMELRRPLLLANQQGGAHHLAPSASREDPSGQNRFFDYRSAYLPLCNHNFSGGIHLSGRTHHKSADKSIRGINSASACPSCATPQSSRQDWNNPPHFDLNWPLSGHSTELHRRLDCRDPSIIFAETYTGCEADKPTALTSAFIHVITVLFQTYIYFRIITFFALGFGWRSWRGCLMFMISCCVCIRYTQ